MAFTKGLPLFSGLDLLNINKLLFIPLNFQTPNSLSTPKDTGWQQVSE